MKVMKYQSSEFEQQNKILNFFKNDQSKYKATNSNSSMQKTEFEKSPFFDKITKKCQATKIL